MQQAKRNATGFWLPARAALRKALPSAAAPPVVFHRISETRYFAAANLRRRDDCHANHPKPAGRSLQPGTSYATLAPNLGSNTIVSAKAAAWHRCPATAPAIAEPAATVADLLFLRRSASQSR